KLKETIIDGVIKAVIPAEYIDKNTVYHVNPTGRFVVGGPQGDCGLTGRKIIVDTYGGMGRHGGGAFSGKDPSKVDRSAAYMARYVAKNIVAAELATRCEVQLAYVIGVARPVSVLVDTFGSGVISEAKLAQIVQDHFDLRPKGIIQALDLKRPIYRSTAASATSGAHRRKANSHGKRRIGPKSSKKQRPAYSRGRVGRKISAWQRSTTSRILA